MEIDLIKLRGIIYLIRNRLNGRCYVGQTINSFYIRYHRSKQWWRNIQCKPLKQDIETLGCEHFEVIILEHSKTRAELDELERHYASLHKSYYPHGYNLKRCGSNQYVNKVPKLLGMGPAKLRSPDGEVFEVEDLISFCNEKQLDKYCIWKLVSGGSNYQLGGWTMADNPATTHPNCTEYTLYDREGNKHVIPNMAEFCRQRGFSYSKMRDVITGRNHEAYGFALSMDQFEKRRKKYIVKLVHEDGREVTLTHIGKECRAIGLHPRFVYDLKNGKLSSYLGWRMTESSYVFF